MGISLGWRKLSVIQLSFKGWWIDTICIIWQRSIHYSCLILHNRWTIVSNAGHSNVLWLYGSLNLSDSHQSCDPSTTVQQCPGLTNWLLDTLVFSLENVALEWFAIIPAMKSLKFITSELCYRDLLTLNQDYLMYGFWAAMKHVFVWVSVNLF